MSIKIALAGNPNSGKTTLFNALTGSNQFVGNWPGVTVEKKEGKLKGNKDVIIMDLPGIYSLSPYTLEEVVARNYLISERPDVILNIIDGTNMERNLYLTTQLLELGIPVVLAVNMMDIVEKNGDKFRLSALEKALGCKAVEISALKGKGIMEAANTAVLAAKQNAKARFCPFSVIVENYLSEISNRLGSNVLEEEKRFYTIKLFERDEKIIESMKHVPEVEDIVAKAEKELEDDSESIITAARYEYIASIIKDCYWKKSKEKLSVSDKIDQIVTNRFLALPIFAAIMFLVYYVSVSTVGTWVTDWANDGVFGDGFHLFGIGNAKYEERLNDYAKEYVWTEEINEVLKQAEDADVIGAGDIREAIKDEDYAAFEEAYGFYADSLVEEGYDIGSLLLAKAVETGVEVEDTDPLEAVMENAPAAEDYGVWVPGIPVLVEQGLDAIHCAEGLRGLILDGIVGGVGAVLGFVPQMLVLFIFLAFLESCGYMARIAFIMDRIFRKFGLSGKSFIPMLIGTGCGVPGIMASRTIENEKDRRMTIMTTTFIPCGAKLPIIALITAALFGGAWWVAPSAYFIGIAAIVISGIILKKTRMFAGEPAPFVMELPAYHLPTIGNVLRPMWERGWSFIKRAGSIILLSSIIIWAGSVFGNTGKGFGFDADMELQDSVLGILGGALKWIFSPLGFGKTTATVATIMGLVAKEEVVGVFGVLDFEALSQIAGYSFLVFNLLCAPCFAAIGAIKREMNNRKWLWFAIGYQCIFAYLVALCIYQIGTLFIEGAFGAGTIVAILVLLLFAYLLFRPADAKKRKISTKVVVE